MANKRDLSILIISGIPIPIETRLIKAVLGERSRSGDFEFLYTAKNVIQIKGQESITLQISVDAKGVGGQLLKVLLPILQALTEITPTTWEIDVNPKSLVKNAYVWLRTSCSFYDYSGIGTFFNYKIAGYSISQNPDTSLIDVNLSFTNAPRTEETSEPVKNVVDATKGA
jgi:hypothetical protein